MELVTEYGETIRCVRITFKAGYALAWDEHGECVWSEKTREIHEIRQPLP